MASLIVFTDLDGTLLNHHDYGFEAVLPMLDYLKQQAIPVILNSSKTLAELDQWQQKLGLNLPVISENGGLVVLEDEEGQASKILIGKPYESIRHILVGLREQNGWQFEGFGDWAVGEVMNQTSLSVADAVLAKEREVTEPIIWNDSEANFQLFKAALGAHQLQVVKGGRFFHVMGHHDKADAMQFLVNRNYFSCGLDCHIVALGDSQNDLAMLRYANSPIVLPNGQGQFLDIPNSIQSAHPAPLGWSVSLNQVLQQFGYDGVENMEVKDE